MFTGKIDIEKNYYRYLKDNLLYIEFGTVFFGDSSKNNVPKCNVQQKRLQANHKIKKTFNIQFDIHITHKHILKDYEGLTQNT